MCERLPHQDWLFSAGLGHYKNRAEKQRMMDGAMSSSTSVLHTSRLEAPSLCKAERLQALNTPLGPYDRNYGRKRLREHSLERPDCEFLEDWTVTQKSSALPSLNILLCPAASPKIFVDASAPCPTLTTLHSALHSPLPRQLSTSSENAMPLGAGSQSISSTPVQKPFFPILHGSLILSGKVCASTLMFCVNQALFSSSSLLGGGEVRAPLI